MSGSARAGTISREAYLRAVNPEVLQCALSRARPRYLCFSIDKDLHGCRLRTEPVREQENGALSVRPVLRQLAEDTDQSE